MFLLLIILFTYVLQQWC